ncbi:hypothetical protein HJG60_008279 [Phyllostomus discolor]|uniref:Uncharacterized protein n=1 Tax=Phyllostomus discolor TaxID=89673 RepID=A0A833Z9D1_9CHIR|nr:hypothetical protein HJG60_008279 [Phyllostomus discolor]
MLSPAVLQPVSPWGPKAFGQRAAPDRKWALRPSAAVYGKEILLTHGFQDCFQIIETPGRDAGKHRRCEEEAAGFFSPSFTCLPKVQRESQPLRAGRVFRPRGRAPGRPAEIGGGRARPCWNPCDVTRVFLGVYAPPPASY